MAKSWVVMNDLQIPYQDKRVLRLVLEFVMWLKPHGVILNGDVVDCYDLSVYTKNPMERRQLQREITEAGELMKKLEWINEKWWLGGNHEDRLRRYIWREAPALQVEATTFPALFKMGKFGFRWKPYGGQVKLGRLIVTHGFLVRAHSAYSAKGHFDRLGNSVLVGHTHRLGAYYKTNQNGVHAAYENGCLCLLKPEYVQFPDWHQGFSVVHVDDSGFFHAQQIPVLNRKVFYYGADRWEV